MTAIVSRTALANALAVALPTAAVHAIPPGSVAGPAIVLSPAGWDQHNMAQVAYHVEIHCLHNAPDTSTAHEYLEVMAATTYLTCLLNGWAVASVKPTDAVEYAGQPFLAITMTATRLVTLAT